MLDTVRLRSPSIDESTAQAVEQSCQRRSAVEIATGELIYTLTTGSLSGSWDERVSIRVMREEWVVLTGRKEAQLVPCEPYIRLEGSVHKAMLGHNVHGGPLDPVAACRWLVADVSHRLSVKLPDGLLWGVRRIDWTEVYSLPNFEAVAEYIHALRMAEMPRRKAHTYPGGVYYPGSTTTVKAYHKGPEFYKHDRKRLRDRLGIQETATLYEQANLLLRFEVEVHDRKLDEDFGHKPLVGEITREYLERVHDQEAGRLLREGQADMRTVRTNRAVSKRLRSLYNPALANTLFGTWMQLSALGEEVVRQEMNRATYYRHRKMLTDAGVSWKGSDIRCIAQLVACPEDFSPVRSDPRRLVDQAPDVERKLRAFAA
jgi:II/X family phage/plasmid replication protein